MSGVDGRATRPPQRIVAPPTGHPAGWYPDPSGAPAHRYYDGRSWTPHVSGHFPAVDRVAHGTLDVRAAFGAAVVLLVSLITSRYVIEWLVTYEWPIVVYAGIAVLLGYGPSVLWCVVAARRWGTGRFFADTGMQVRWVDLGWGPLVWVAAIAGQLVAVVVIEAFGIPLVSNTEGISDLARDRTYVISILVTTVVAAPVVEELVFRGVMLRGLRSRLPAVAAVGGQGAVFGLAHFDPVRGRGNIGLVLVLTSVGIVLGGAAYLLRRIGPTMVAHAILNGVVMTVVLTR
jgi:membrane protease YdiL (CAAX protease family)